MTDGDAEEATEALERLGLSKYEAQVFIALTKLGTGTARDVDRMTDVPRSQVYGAAETLEQRGLVDVQQSSPIQYRAVSLSEARDVLRERFEREQDRAFDYLEHARRASGDHEDEHQEGVWTVHGRENVATRVEQLVADADDRVLYVTPGELVDDDIVAALDERAADVDVWVFHVDEAAARAFEGTDVSLVAFPEDEAEVTGRLLAVDGDTILLSVLGDEELPGVRRETAIWSSETGFATVLLQLVGSHIDEDIGTKL